MSLTFEENLFLRSTPGLWMPGIDMELYGHVLATARVVENNKETKPFTWAYRVQLRSIDPWEVEQLYETLKNFLDDRGLNHAIVISQADAIILVEEDIEINALMFKLTVGTNVVSHQKFDFKPWVDENPLLAKACAHVFRGLV